MFEMDGWMDGRIQMDRQTETGVEGSVTLIDMAPASSIYI